MKSSVVTTYKALKLTFFLWFEKNLINDIEKSSSVVEIEKDLYLGNSANLIKIHRPATFEASLRKRDPLKIFFHEHIPQRSPKDLTTNYELSNN